MNHFIVYGWLECVSNDRKQMEICHVILFENSSTIVTYISHNEIKNYAKNKCYTLHGLLCESSNIFPISCSSEITYRLVNEAYQLLYKNDNSHRELKYFFVNL